MLRMALVSVVILVGIRYAIRDAFGALLFYLWFAYFRPEYWVWNLGALQALNLSLITGVFLLVRTLFSRVEYRLDLRSALLVLFVGLSLMSTMVSNRDDYAWPWWTDFAKAVVVAYLISILITNLSQFRTALIVIAFSLGFEGAKQGWVGILLRPGGRNMNDFASLGDNNGVAIGMLMMVAVFIALAKTAQTHWERRLHQFFMIGIAYRAIVTYSRGGFIAAAAVACVWVLRSKQKFQSAVAAILVGGTLLSMLPQSFWTRMSTIPLSQGELQVAIEGEDPQEADTSASSRLHYWRVAIHMALDNPLLGVGLNAYSRFYNDYDFLGGVYGRRRSVHSIWFGILAELGIPAFMLFLTMLGLAMAGCQSVARRAHRGELPAEYYTYAVAIQTAFVACLVGGSFLPFQYTEILWHFVGLSMALRAMAMKAAKATSPALATVYAPPVPRRFQSTHAT